MKIDWLLVLPIMSFGFAANAAPGGTKTPKDVTIDLSNAPLVVAVGGLGSTRYDTPPTAGTPKEIGCKIEPDQTGAVASCWAYLGADKIRCSSAKESFIRAVAAVNGDSMVMFSTSTQEDPNHVYGAYECRAISVENASTYLPKGP